MSYTSLWTYEDAVRIQCPGAVPAIVREALKRAAQRFLRDTEVWAYEFDPIDIVAETDEYTLTVPTGRVLLRLLRASSDGDLVQYPLPLEAILVDSRVPSVTLSQEPAEALEDGLIVEFALGNADSATDIPSWIADRWGRGIQAEARAILMAQPGRPWSNPQFAGAERSEYQDAVQDALMSRVTKDSSAPLTMEVAQVL